MMDFPLSPFAQDHAYHAFADTRTFLGIPNFRNVSSNLPFLVVGTWGLAFLARSGSCHCDVPPPVHYDGGKTGDRTLRREECRSPVVDIPK